MFVLVKGESRHGLAVSDRALYQSMGKQSAKLAVAGELQRAEALGLVSVLVAIVIAIACVVCVTNAFANTTLMASPPPPPPAPPPLLSYLFNPFAPVWLYEWFVTP